MIIKRILSVILCAVMLLSATACAASLTAPVETPKTVSASSQLTREQAAGIILAAAVKYRSAAEAEDVARDLPASADGAMVTRGEMLAMLSGAFGPLPEPVGDTLRNAPAPAEYTDAPDWARPAIDNLNHGRVLVGSEDKLLKPDEAITVKELDTMIKRIYALYGTRLQDDFYVAVNKEWLETSVITDRNPTVSMFSEIQDRVDAQVDEIMNRVLAGTWEKGTPERKIVDYYNSYMDQESQIKTGAAPLKPYLDKLAAASTMDELMDALEYLAEGTAVLPFITHTIMADMKDSLTNAVYIDVYMESVVMMERTDEKQAEYASMMFEFAGYPNPKESGTAAISIESALMAASENASRSDDSDMNSLFARLTLDQLREKLPQMNIARLLATSGLKEAPVYIIRTAGMYMFEELEKLFTADNVKTLSAYAAYSLLREYRTSMGDEFFGINTAVYGGSDEPLDPAFEKHLAMMSMKDAFAGYLSNVYAKEHFSPEAKAEVLEMVMSFINSYRDRIRNLTWMSDTTKAMAIKKLDTMAVNVGYPNKEDTFIDDLTVVSIEDGGSYLANRLAVNRRVYELTLAKQNQPVDRKEWSGGYRSYTVNAQYNPLANTITFPAGILQAPFYSVDQKPEQNLGAIGVTIAHEITHAFDSSGAQFDEMGNVANWWTDEDKAKFIELQQAVIAHYDGAESAPGLVIDGKRTLGENIADLGGVSCALEALRKEVAQPDYALFFTSAAQSERHAYREEELESMLSFDPHSDGSARANKLYQTFNEFFDAFGIVEGDGMYVAPELRVKIW